jgi:hypothetical protein
VNASGPARRLATAWMLALVFGAASCAIAGAAWRGLPQPKPLEELSYYPSGQALKPATLGHAETAADLAWLRAVQYYGEHRQSDNRFHRMAHVFDILTSLSPGFEAAHVFGAFALAQEGGDFPAGEALLRKGLAHDPRSGSLAFHLGFLHYVRPGGRDLRRAAEWFEQAARAPDPPAAAARFAAFSRQHAGDLLLAQEMWAEIRDGSDNPYLSEIAQREIDRIEQARAAGRHELAVKRLTTPTVRFE